MESTRIEVEIEDRHEFKVIEVEGNGLDAILKEVRKLAALDDVHVFERDGFPEFGAFLVGHGRAARICRARMQSASICVSKAGRPANFISGRK